MKAVILHAAGDEILAEGVASRIAPAESFPAALRANAGLTLGDQLAIFVVWSAQAAADGGAAALSQVSADARGRCVVIRADGTPLPRLDALTHVITSTSATSEFLFYLKAARALIDPVVPARAERVSAGSWAPGVSIGFAIYAGMFVTAGAWRSQEVTDALESGKAVPLASALHSFQMVAQTATDTVRIADAQAEPAAARFVTPQRVVITTALDSSGALPVVAGHAPAPLEDAMTPPIAAQAPTPLRSVEASVTPITFKRPVVAQVTAPALTPVTGLVSVDDLHSLEAGAF